MNDSPPSSQPVQTTPDAVEIDITPKSVGRPMPPWEIHFRFWMWICFTIGGCYVLYAFQEVIKAATNPHSLAYSIFSMLLLVFGVALSIDAMPDHERRKPVKIQSVGFVCIVIYLLIFFGFVAYLGYLTLSVRPMPLTPPPPPAPSSIPVWIAVLQSILLNPLFVIWLGLSAIKAHTRKFRGRLREIAKLLKPVDG